MVNSKAWNWAEITEPFWREPSEDVYYYVHRWKKKEFNTLLDLGCGIGRHSMMFAQNGFTVFSLDLSKSGIDKLKKMAYEKNDLMPNSSSAKGSGDKVINYGKS